LALEDDYNKLNTLHCFIRSELLEIFVVDQSICSSPTSAAGSGSALGRVGLRCVHCAQERKRLKVSERDEAPMAVFYPSAFPKFTVSLRLGNAAICANAETCRLKSRAMGRATQGGSFSRQDSLLGTSATQLGLVDCQSKGRGVRFAAEMMMEQPAM
jgi:hypothetical protein